MVTDDEIPVTAGETGDPGNEPARDRVPIGADAPADLDAIITGALTVLDHAEPQDLYLPELAPSDQERVEGFAKRGRADATLQAYKSDWDLFLAWCLERRYRPLPASPATVAAFLSELATTGFTPAAERRTKTGKLRAPRLPRPLTRSTIDRRLAAIVFAHRMAKVEPPTSQPGASDLGLVMGGIRRTKAGEKKRKKRAADGDILRDMLRSIAGDDLRAHRDRALLAIGMGGAFRRSELVAITVDRVTRDREGLTVTVAASKTDQFGEGQGVAVLDGPRLEPVRHYEAWIAIAGITEGPVFRKLTPQGRLTAKPMSTKGVALVVKAAAAAAGYPAEAFSGHSLRAGFLTEAGRQNANLFKMREHSRHASIEMVAEYVRDTERYRDHAGKAFM
ncbi:integrase [Sphingomonas sp. BE138]|uniref:tyrosine-type recombinase/integrase n=1 Tax=Sphingomonas sp. BE138 TaxID=2817845 RepID=UPI002861C484|nr:tyrosine-type recombinase/integrase [Sphingomonas sp. BE138]MDR6790837.1 integrase [Sphingomonas sp. BE138]